jgi:uncharacterized protein YndB with AHSA1/START domain
MTASTELTQHIQAPCAAVYRALIDDEAAAQWMVPEDMTSQVHQFEVREGGSFRISLTYDAPTGAGKTSANTDTYHGRFVRLVPDRLVVQAIAFESDDPAMRGEMTVTLSLSPVDGGTELRAVHANLPPGLSPEDNAIG